MSRYSWLPKEQKKLFDRLCDAFGFKTFADIGRYFTLNNPSDSVKSIFKARKPNIYLLKLVEEKEISNKEIAGLKEANTQISNLDESIAQSISILAELQGKMKK
jgi:hypothetical protein